MNNSIKKSLLFSIQICCVAFCFISCQDPIFSEIEQEIQLTDASIRGDVNGFTRLTVGDNDYLYLENNGVYVKAALPSKVTHITDGAWRRFTSIGDSYKAWDLVSDSKYIYIIASKWDDDEGVNDDGEQIEKSRIVLCSEGVKDGGYSPWQAVNMPENCYLLPLQGRTDTYYTSRIFSNNARSATGESTSDAKAYIRLWSDELGWAIYDLNGTEEPVLNEEAPNSSNVAFFYQGKTYFSSQQCATVNAFDNIVFTPYAENFDDGFTTTPVGSDALSIATVGNYILIGTNAGVRRRYYNGSILEHCELVTNTDSTLSEDYRIPMLFALTPGAESDIDTDIYAALTYNGTSGSTKVNHICLWAYYTERGKWNRE